MNRRSLWSVGVLMLAGVVGCERDLPFIAPPDQPVAGYHLEGYVTDRLGVPVRGLQIALWYQFDYLDSNPPAGPLFTVPDSSAEVLVRVLDYSGAVRDVLFRGHHPAGLLDAEWDERDSTGAPVASGVYRIEFSLNGVVKGSSTAVVNGAVTTVTDSLGHYSIPAPSLPIEFFPAPLYTSDGTRFLGNYQVANDVILEFYLSSHRSASVTLTKDQITRFDYRI